jgi:hypothetical protein
MGLLSEMQIETASGPVQIGVLANKTVLNPDFSVVVLTWTGSRLFVTEAFDFRSIGEQQIFDVELDDGSLVKVSPSSQFILKNGSTKMPPELSPGDSLLPLYLAKNANGYPTYQIPGHAVKKKISRLMAEWVLGHALEKGTYVEHIDGNRENYHPDNLRIYFDAQKAKRSHKNIAVKTVGAADALFNECAAASPLMAEIVKPKKKTNHKVVRSTPGRLDEVFTASVRTMGSLSISGVFLDLPA